MSSNNSTNQTRSEKNERVNIRFTHYFDIFYRVLKGLFTFFLFLIMIIGALGGGTVIGYFASLVEDIPIPTEVEMRNQVNSYGIKSSMYYADNSLISDLRSDLLRSPIPLEQMSPLVLNALIATEDENFYKHEGIVPKALIRAGLQEFTNAAMVSGGSTLTQQLIKQQILSAEVTHERKAVEILYATHLENKFGKDQILESYMNISPFGRNNHGQNIAGIEEAAQGIFGVAASELTLPQATFLAGLPKSPISYSPYTQFGEVKEDLSAGLSRQKEVLYSMYREGYITQEDYDFALEYDVTLDFLRRGEEDNKKRDPRQSYLYDLVEKEAKDILFEMIIEEDGITQEQLNGNPELRAQYREKADTELRDGGYDIYSTIDPIVHNAMQRSVQNYKERLGRTKYLAKRDKDNEFIRDEDGEIIYEELPVQVGGTLIENGTGRVLGFIGGRDYDYEQHNNAFNSRRGTGSAIKPLMVYGPALAENYITPATIIPDTEFTINKPGQEPWTPRNVIRTTNEWRDARHWLAVSQNLPNIKIYMGMREAGIDIPKYIRAMGIGPEAIDDNHFIHESTSLGQSGNGPTITEVTGAYAMIGNGGEFNEPYIIERIVNNQGEVIYQHELNPTRVWAEDSNYLLYDMLRGVTTVQGATATRVPGMLNFNIDLASKTGTTNNNADVWYVGTTPTVSLTSWMGYDNQNLGLETEFGMYPGLRNTHFWSQVMNEIYRVNPDILGIGQRVTPPTDGSLKSESVLASTGMKPGSIELSAGQTVNVTGATKSELFRSSNIPGITTLDFAVGATAEELQKFWENMFNAQNAADDNSEDEDQDAEDEVEEESEDEETDEPEPTPPADDSEAPPADNENDD